MIDVNLIPLKRTFILQFALLRLFGDKNLSASIAKSNPALKFLNYVASILSVAVFHETGYSIIENKIDYSVYVKFGFE